LKTRLRGARRAAPVLAAALAAVLGYAPVQAAVATVAVGDPKNPGALAQAVQDAYQSGARRIVIRPGVYTLPDVGHTAFALDGWKDATLSAYGVTLIITDLKWGHNVFDLHLCTRVTLAGSILSQSAVTAYQGRVVAVGRDAAGKATCDWRPDAGYPVPPEKEPKGFLGGDVNVVDGRTRLLKTGVGDFYGVAGEALGDGAYRVHFPQTTLNFGVGDRLVGRHGDAPFKVYLDDSRDCTIRDVTLMRNGFAPIREDGGGGNRYLHCVWALGPRPQRATEDPIVSTQADGMHMIGSYPGPDIEGCVFRGVFLDDCIAIHGGFTAIKSVSGTTLTLGSDGGLKVGQPARISGEKGFFGEATVIALKDNGDKTWTVTLDRDLGVPPNAKVSNPLRDGAGYKIIGCRLGNTRSRGILVKADGGIIRNNIIEGCGQAAVSLGPEYYWNEADYVQNVIVVGNTLRENGKAGYGGGAVLVHGDGAMGNRNIVVKDNLMLSNFQGDIDAAWADGLTITGNTFTAPPAPPAGAKPQPPISVRDARNVRVGGNHIKTPDGYAQPFVHVGPNVLRLTQDFGAPETNTKPAHQTSYQTSSHENQTILASCPSAPADTGRSVHSPGCRTSFSGHRAAPAADGQPPAAGSAAGGEPVEPPDDRPLALPIDAREHRRGPVCARRGGRGRDRGVQQPGRQPAAQRLRRQPGHALVRRR